MKQSKRELPLHVSRCDLIALSVHHIPPYDNLPSTLIVCPFLMRSTLGKRPIAGNREMFRGVQRKCHSGSASQWIRSQLCRFTTLKLHLFPLQEQIVVTGTLVATLQFTFKRGEYYEHRVHCALWNLHTL